MRRAPHGGQMPWPLRLDASSFSCPTRWSAQPQKAVRQDAGLRL